MDGGSPFAAIGNLIEDEVNSMQAIFNSYTMPMVTFNKAEKPKKRKDLMNGLLRSAYYPFVSEGRVLTCSQGSLFFPKMEFFL